MRLREARKNLGLSIDELTKRAWISYVTYVKIERAESTNPYVRNLAKVARVLDISLDELISDMYLSDTDLPEGFESSWKAKSEEKKKNIP